MNYLKRRYTSILTAVLPCVAYNLYFLFLLPEVKVFYLLYLDFLIAVGMGLWFCADYSRDRLRQRKKQEFLERDSVIWKEFRDGEDADIMAHDAALLEEQLKEQFAMNCEQQDYFAGWCHEVKIPLTASLLLAEKMKESSLKQSMKEQLERINLQLRTAMLGAKLQSSLFDLKVGRTSLLQCVKNSVHNNQFFLIRSHFTLEIEIGEGEEVFVYTDPSWLTYVLDQLLGNAVKYAGKQPKLKIYSRKREDALQLCVEDNGEGIKESDIRRIFEKGYTGSNRYNGKYKSTGMGLYMVSVILGKLGHEILVESEYQKGSRFTITFRDIREYLQLDQA